MKSLIYILMVSLHTLAVASHSHSSFHSDKFPKRGYQLTFYENFSQRPGSLPSSQNWELLTGTSYPGGAANWGNSESETYTNSSLNIHITPASTLLITPLLLNGTWTSARMESISSFSCAASSKLYIESRFLIPATPISQSQGIWPAFWALGTAFRGNYTNWPRVSEWDFMESLNGIASLWTTIHCGTAPGGPCDEYNGIGSQTNMTRGEWHTIGFEVDREQRNWRHQTMKWYLDGSEIFKVEGGKVNDTSAWRELTAKEHYLVFNVAVGGGFPNALSENGTTPTGSTVDGRRASFEVDYVGVWNSI
jgi:hypothetical protein